MVKFWKYIQHVVIVILVIELGCFIVDKVVSEEDSISSLELALRMAKDNRTELEKVLYYYQQDAIDSLKYKAACFFDRKYAILLLYIWRTIGKIQKVLCVAEG